LAVTSFGISAGRFSTTRFGC